LEGLRRDGRRRDTTGSTEAPSHDFSHHFVVPFPNDRLPHHRGTGDTARRRTHAMSIQTVASELRSLRARIDAQQDNPHSWPTKEEEQAADVDRYDRRLLKAAAMVGVEAPVPRRGDAFLLGDEERRLLEARLAGAGIDVRAPDPADERSPR
jgi:hypothetical protein